MEKLNVHQNLGKLIMFKMLQRIENEHSDCNASSEHFEYVVQGNTISLLLPRFTAQKGNMLRFKRHCLFDKHFEFKTMESSREVFMPK